MFPFKQDLSSRQKNKSAGKNSCKYIILHHTATGYSTVNGNIKTLLGETSRQVSCHFLVDTNGESYKLGNPDMILWHAGQSEWKGLKDLNKHSVGIEVIGPLPGFTDEERHTVLWLVQHLMAVLNIHKENVIRHADLTWEGSSKGILWDGKSKSRKTDIQSSFFLEGSFEKWRDKLLPKEWK